MISVIFFIYVFLVVIPFLKLNLPATEIDLEWRYEYAPFVYALLFYPAVWLWCYVIAKNILNVKYIRTIIYSLIYIIAFITAHMIFFIFSTVILWFCLLTIPIGIILFIAILVGSIIYDVKDIRANESITHNSQNKSQELLTALVNYALPMFFICIIAQSGFFIYIQAHPLPPDTTPCKNFSNAIQLATKSIESDNNDTLVELTEKYEKEFNNINKYSAIWGSYNHVSLRKLNKEQVEIYIRTKRNEKVYNSKYTLLFEKEFNSKVKCDIAKKNCSWKLESDLSTTCTHYYGNNTAIQSEETKEFLKLPDKSTMPKTHFSLFKNQRKD